LRNLNWFSHTEWLVQIQIKTGIVNEGNWSWHQSPEKPVSLFSYSTPFWDLGKSPSLSRLHSLLWNEGLLPLSPDCKKCLCGSWFKKHPSHFFHAVMALNKSITSFYLIFFHHLFHPSQGSSLIF
jgi:hypothetical protein